jgi:hypothetical protein
MARAGCKFIVHFYMSSCTISCYDKQLARSDASLDTKSDSLRSANRVLNSRNPEQ